MEVNDLIPIGHYPVAPLETDFVEEKDVKTAFFRGSAEFFTYLTHGGEIVQMNNFTPGSVLYLRYCQMRSIAKVNVKLCRYIFAPANAPLEIHRCTKSTIFTYCPEHYDRVAARKSVDPNAEAARVSALLMIKQAIDQGMTKEQLLDLLMKAGK